ncbi:hypothetical protein L3X38_003479 [Prunus dulcis]|uniref:Uncharacterized protein n=1 Tax=Prunus dulcis TaxID=3755 RepID=A0AAD4ZM59_PRUDU|nr:hypothetical protein L3X38_003479 [Prunus dulcis]
MNSPVSVVGMNFGKCPIYRGDSAEFSTKASVYSKRARHRGDVRNSKGVVTHPGIAPASNSLNFGVPTNPKPVSSQKASRYEDARVVTHPGIAPASNSLNFGVPTNPKPVSSQKASRYKDARCAI